MENMLENTILENNNNYHHPLSHLCVGAYLLFLYNAVL